MSETRQFVIRRSFLVPLGLLLLLALLLLGVSITQGQPTAKLVILAGIILPVAGLFVESAFRRVSVSSEQLLVDKVFRQKTLQLDEITAVETVQVRKRAFLTLCAGDEFIILSNAYADFPGLVRTLLERVPPASISAETAQMAEAPPVKTADIVTCWLAVLLLGFILVIQWQAG